MQQLIIAAFTRDARKVALYTVHFEIKLCSSMTMVQRKKQKQNIIRLLKCVGRTGLPECKLTHKKQYKNSQHKTTYSTANIYMCHIQVSVTV